MQEVFYNDIIAKKKEGIQMKLTKKQKKYIIETTVALIVLIAGIITGTAKKEEILEVFGIQTTNISEDSYKVISVTDGDTFKINYNGKETKVRLIGVDTPESVHPDKEKNTEYGKQASNYTKSLIENKTVKLEFDVSQTDKYGRLLAYVYLENGEMLNEKLVKEGYAKVATYPPNVKYVEKFESLQKQARENKVGFWKEDVF